MSINIHFMAERDIQVLKTKKVEKQIKYFDCVVQTPTEITRKIIASQDPFQAYREYVLSSCKDYIEPVYADDDFFGLGDSIGEIVKNNGPECVKEFDEWLKTCEENGYIVSVEAW